MMGMRDPFSLRFDIQCTLETGNLNSVKPPHTGKSSGFHPFTECRGLIKALYGRMQYHPYNSLQGTGTQYTNQCVL